MIRAACQAQIDGAGFSIVEVLSNCPVGWGMSAPASMEHLAEVSETYPLGVLVDRAGEAR
jgi:2-oxoglutarate ferredoxin oxidoreductase subunit beta